MVQLDVNLQISHGLNWPLQASLCQDAPYFSCLRVVAQSLPSAKALAMFVLLT